MIQSINPDTRFLGEPRPWLFSPETEGFCAH